MVTTARRSSDATAEIATSVEYPFLQIEQDYSCFALAQAIRASTRTTPHWTLQGADPSIPALKNSGDAMTNLSEEGTISCWAKGGHADWATNGNGYTFPEIKGKGILLQTANNDDLTIAVTIVGPLNKTTSFTVPIPSCGEKGLYIAVSWSRSDGVKLYLNGVLTETKS